MSMSEPLTWVEQTAVIDAIDPARRAIEENGGWRLLHVGMGSGGQTTLTYGWPWPGTPQDVTLCSTCGQPVVWVPSTNEAGRLPTHPGSDHVPTIG
jgi:hypothetical protein